GTQLEVKLALLWKHNMHIEYLAAATWPLDLSNRSTKVEVLSLQHSGSKDPSQSQFASYWKPILSMDTNFWQRWLHMHRIAIILEHDL
ncbi:hypothetical protein GOODEAATRI_029061, partial [Goodea atripinnis]